MLITFSKVKKKNKIKEKGRTYLLVRSGTVRSDSSVRPVSVPKKKERERYLRS